MSMIIRLVVVLAAILVGCGTRQEPKRYDFDYSTYSGFSVENVDSIDVDNLTVLAKVWGFAKYHHPVFADSVHNIDYELFELLPRVATATKDERNDVLAEWIENLGEFRSVEKKLRKEISDESYTSPTDWEWLEDENLLGTELAGLLQNLRWARRPKPGRYAQLSGWNRSPSIFISFDAESTYRHFFGNDAGYRLLTLFRLWNMAEYYFPSVNITNKKWSEVLPEYIPKFINATDSIRWTTAELIAELSDTHSGMSKNPVYPGCKLPVELGFVEGKLIVTDNRKFLAADAGPTFEAGDEIVSIDGHTPDYFVERARKYIAASNENVLLRNAANIAGRVAHEMFKIPVVVEREGRQVELSISPITSQEYYKRGNQWVDEKQPYNELLNDSIGYLYPGKFKNADGAEIMAKFADTKGIVIDFRCYPSDFMPFEFVGRYFVPSTTQHVIFTKAVRKLPGYFYEEPTSLGFKNNDYYKGKVVVLVNEQTQSSAEYQTMAFQAAPNTIVVGSQTAGADGNVVTLPLPGGISTRFSGLGVFYPDGTNTQRTGVRIDHYVTPTIEGIRAGRDEVLEKALEIVQSK